MIFSRIKQDATLAGSTFGYRALQIELPMLGTGSSITGTTSAIYVGKDWTASGYQDVFDYGINIATGTCLRALYAACSTSGSAHLKVVDINVTDATTQSSGYNASFFCEVTNTGAMTPTEYSAARFNLILNTGTKTGLMNALKAKVGTGAAPTLTSAIVNGFFVSMDDIGACSRQNCIWLESYDTSTTESSFIEMHSQSTAQLKYMFRHIGVNVPTHFFRLQSAGASGFWDILTTTDTDILGHINVRFGDTEGYINVYVSTS